MAGQNIYIKRAFCQKHIAREGVGWGLLQGKERNARGQPERFWGLGV